MAEQKESSVLFSLKELMSLEENRIKEEEADKEAVARAEADAKAAAERAARDAEERRLRAEEEARRTEEQRRKEEATRLDAIRHGELEKARAETEHRSRMEALAVQQAHEQQIAALNSDQGKKRLKLVVGIISAVLVIGGIATGVVLSNNAKEQKAKEAIAAAQQAETQKQLDALKSQYDEAQKHQEELERQRDSAKDEATRARLEAELSKAKKDTQAAGAAVGAVRSTGPAKSGGGSSKPCACTAGDPLCSCL
jgi:colicin import membrane protein